MRTERLERLERALGHTFLRRELLQQAVTHRSYGTPHNERIEFLGDSVLNCVIAARLFELFPGLREGELSRLRANLVRQETLFAIAQELTLGNYLRLGEGELKSGGFRRPSILADALEALFGAIFLEAGFEAARSVILRLYDAQFKAIDPRQAGKDPKTALQEILQGRRLALPQYVLLTTRGEAHAQEFEVECRVAELDVCVRGIGSSRRSAEQEAAQQVCRILDGR
ncbi:RNase III [Sterolibacterium denitrificans]|uniref:Ribonuclease 3 n=1 Tax=Sterolibacterium denitrificans TaxID=157592 RepID=A0A7Z7HRG4_9PROT|nr:ribonuclease III [Sterolibacterium denitrificans]SMB26096.1 RNase III [Sterolibacterium denitrificans]